LFFDGVGGYTPPPTPNEYNLSSGCEPTVMIPASAIDVGIITLCDTAFAVEQVFATQADLINFLNTIFVSAFGLTGSFFIDSNELIYSTSDDCDGTNCIALNETEGARITEDSITRETEDGQTRVIE